MTTSSVYNDHMHFAFPDIGIRRLLLPVLLLLPTLAFKKHPADPVRWMLTKQCSLKVNGSTNINKFSCVIPEYSQPDTLTFNQVVKDEPVKITGSMILDVEKFDCKHVVMTSDLRKTLKAKAYPKLIVRFLSLGKYPDMYDHAEVIKGTVTIELAGVVKRFEVDYSYLMRRDGDLRLIGTKQVRFSDFNLIPPRKLGGMIKTDDDLHVEFVLNVKILNLIK